MNETILELYAQYLLEHFVHPFKAVLLPVAYFTIPGSVPALPKNWKFENQRLTFSFVSFNHHWTLIVIDSKLDAAHLFDSLTIAGQDASVIQERVDQLTGRHLRLYKYSVVQQSDSSSCGLFALFYMEMLLTILPSCTTPRDIAIFISGQDIDDRNLFRNNIEAAIRDYHKHRKLITSKTSASW
jgi:Ulp1 family protease